MVSTFYFRFLAPLFYLLPCMNIVVTKKHSPPIPMFADNFTPFRSPFDRHFLMGIFQVALTKLNILLHKMKTTTNSKGRFHQPSRSDNFFLKSYQLSDSRDIFLFSKDICNTGYRYQFNSEYSVSAQFPLFQVKRHPKKNFCKIIN